MSDCEALLDARDTLAGSGSLNWSEDTPITDWDGVTIEGAPQRVTGLELRSRGLTGEIPTELGNLSNLQALYLHVNQLTGEIPAELGELSNLKILSLSSNQLTGEIPTDLGELSNLEILSLSSNQLTEEIPAELGELSNLEFLSLSSNQLTEEIPAELGELSNLEFLSLSSNQLTGVLPKGLTALMELEGIVFYNNSGLCAPTDEAFQTWLESIATVRGSSCALVDWPGDRTVLIELYSATDGANWTNNTNWLSDRPIREWHGVTNDANGRVTGLYLPQKPVER